MNGPKKRALFIDRTYDGRASNVQDLRERTTCDFMSTIVQTHIRQCCHVFFSALRAHLPPSVFLSCLASMQIILPYLVSCPAYKSSPSLRPQTLAAKWNRLDNSLWPPPLQPQTLRKQRLVRLRPSSFSSPAPTPATKQGQYIGYHIAISLSLRS